MNFTVKCQVCNYMTCSTQYFTLQFHLWKSVHKINSSNNSLNCRVSREYFFTIFIYHTISATTTTLLRFSNLLQSKYVEITTKPFRDVGETKNMIAFQATRQSIFSKQYKNYKAELHYIRTSKSSKDRNTHHQRKAMNQKLYY